MSKLKTILKEEAGMTLIEVTVAVFLFAVFITAFMVGQGDNINDSMTFKNELLMKDIAEMKMNETLVNPPEDFRPQAGKVNVNEAKMKFEEIEEYPDYKFAVQLFKITIPDYDKLVANQEGEDNPNEDQSIRKRIFDNFKNNMETLVWQVMVTIRHEPTGATYDLSTWFYNQGGRLQFDIN